MSATADERIDYYDLVVIGSGPAGEKAAVQAAYFGKRVAIVERLELMGGVAVTNVGMIPTKTLREAALYITGFRKREIYGMSVDLDAHALYATLHKRTNDVIETMSNAVRTNIERHRVDLVRGTGQLAGGTDVRVTTVDGGARLLRAKVVIVATGSRPYHPPDIPFDDPDVLDPEGVLQIDSAPSTVVVVGGGAIGCEHASIFTALGSKVALVNRGDRLLPYVDAEVAHLLSSLFEHMGMHVRHDTVIERIERDANGLRVALSDGTEERPDKVVVASGRSGNTEGLGLEAAGVALDDRNRIVVDEHFQTSVPGIYAAGDVIGPPALASTSMEQGRVAACHAFGFHFKDMVDPSPPVGVYSIPEVAAVGLTEEGATEQGIPYLVGRGRFEGNSRANISGAVDGMVKLVFARSDKSLLGVHILGDDATEAIHVGQAVIAHGDTIDYFIHKTFNVPTLCEAYKYAAYDGLQHWQAAR